MTPIDAACEHPKTDSGNGNHSSDCGHGAEQRALQPAYRRHKNTRTLRISRYGSQSPLPKQRRENSQRRAKAFDLTFHFHPHLPR